jgi:hypothetical protein
MRDMTKESQYPNREDSVVKRSWQEFFELVDKLDVPDDFLVERGDDRPQKRSCRGQECPGHTKK